MNSEQIAERQKFIIDRNKRQTAEDDDFDMTDSRPAWGPEEIVTLCILACMIIAVACLLMAIYRPGAFPQRTAIASVVVPTCNRCHLSEGRIKSLSEYRRANPSPRERLKVRPVDLTELTEKERP